MPFFSRNNQIILSNDAPILIKVQLLLLLILFFLLRSTIIILIIIAI